MKTLRRLLAIGWVALAWTSAASAGPLRAENLRNQPDEWFTSDEGKRVVDNIVSWQNPWGGWLKEYDAREPRPDVLPTRELPHGIPAGSGDGWNSVSTFDNGATFSELRILARAIRVTGNNEYRTGFDKGLSAVLDAQYPNGGFPQRFPPPQNYGRYITFNDNAMTNVLRMLKEIANGSGDFAFVEPQTRHRAREAFDRGIGCILDAQIKVNGQLTAWCQQHDEVTLEPAGARTYELPSLCTFESAEIVLLLMDLPDPDERVKTAVESAVAWFERSKLTGLRYERINDPGLEFGVDRRLIEDPNAPPLWARFYDIETNRPFFSDRDGIKRWSLDEVGAERRARYAWYNTAPGKVLKAYPKWKAAHS